MENNLLAILFFTLTIAIFQGYSLWQKQLNKTWFNPMLLTILTIIALLLFFDFSFEQYYSAAVPLNNLLEPAVIALGFPLYQHLHSIRKNWQRIFALLTLGAIITLAISFVSTMILLKQYDIAVSLSLKSVTTPIGIALTEQLQGNSSITTFSIILAGLFGALLGPSWLSFIKVKSPKAQGLAIGAASHALGTATISKISYEHAAYSSLALIMSAVITAVVSPFLIPLMVRFF